MNLIWRRRSSRPDARQEIPVVQGGEDVKFYTADGKLDRQYLRVCAVFRLLKFCRIDQDQAVTLLAERRIRDPESTVSKWVDGFERNEWNEMRPRTILGAPYVGPRP